jgi:hypothetical protein
VPDGTQVLQQPVQRRRHDRVPGPESLGMLAKVVIETVQGNVPVRVDRF